MPVEGDNQVSTYIDALILHGSENGYNGYVAEDTTHCM